MKRSMLWAAAVLLLVLGWQVGRMWPGGLLGPQTGSPAAKQPPAPESPAPAPAAKAPPTPGPETPVTGPSCQPGQAADYFPYHNGTKAVYAGLGNEYASYTVKVIGESGGKVEWRRDNGGTVSAEVFQVAPQQVTRVFREGEAYDNTLRMNLPPNQSEIIIKGPVQVGTSWTSGNTTYTIQSVTATVQALNQTLTCSVQVDEQSTTSLIRTFYHKQYGMILTVFDPTGSAIESRLSSFTP